MKPFDLIKSNIEEIVQVLENSQEPDILKVLSNSNLLEEQFKQMMTITHKVSILEFDEERSEVIILFKDLDLIISVIYVWYNQDLQIHRRYKHSTVQVSYGFTKQTKLELLEEKSKLENILKDGK